MNKLLPEQWIMLVGVVFFSVVTIIALDPSEVLLSNHDPKKIHSNANAIDFVASSSPVPATIDGRQRAVNAPANTSIAGQAVNMQMVNADPRNRQRENNMQPVQWATGTMQSQSQARAQAAAMTPFNVAPPIAFQGVVEQVVNRDPGGWGQIHIFIRTNRGLQELSLAPEWYLSSMACAPAQGQIVQGEAMSFDSKNPGGVMYVKNMTTQQGITCRLRNPVGFALWSNQLQ